MWPRAETSSGKGMSPRGTMPAKNMNAAAPPADPEPILELIDVHKRFGSTHALRGVDFAVRPGEVHALLGENGSGKSTLMKIAYGEYARAAAGSSSTAVARTFARPHAPRSRPAIAAVPQEVPLVESLSVIENILLGRLPRHGPRVDWQRRPRPGRGGARDARDADRSVRASRPPSAVGPPARGDRASARGRRTDPDLRRADELARSRPCGGAVPRDRRAEAAGCGHGLHLPAAPGRARGLRPGDGDSRRADRGKPACRRGRSPDDHGADDRP